MKEKITVVVGKDGNISTDFNGFTGEHCFSEAEELQKMLENLGVEIEVKHLSRKPPKSAETQEGHDTTTQKQKGGS
jgi:hypothetical protein